MRPCTVSAINLHCRFTDVDYEGPHRSLSTRQTLALADVALLEQRGMLDRVHSPFDCIDGAFSTVSVGGRLGQIPSRTKKVGSRGLVRLDLVAKNEIHSEFLPQDAGSRVVPGKSITRSHSSGRAVSREWIRSSE